jgi:hypothetical protein
MTYDVLGRAWITSRDRVQQLIKRQFGPVGTIFTSGNETLGFDQRGFIYKDHVLFFISYIEVLPLIQSCSRLTIEVNERSFENRRITPWTLRRGT